MSNMCARWNSHSLITRRSTRTLPGLGRCNPYGSVMLIPTLSAARCERAACAHGSGPQPGVPSARSSDSDAVTTWTIVPSSSIT